MRATMRAVGVAVGVSALLLAGAGARAGEPPNAGTPSNPGFEKLKGLVGEWEGTAPDGKPGTISYKLVSAGSAIVESIGGPNHPDTMITVYHPDGGPTPFGGRAVYTMARRE